MKRLFMKQIVGLVVLATRLHGGEFLVLKTDDPLGGTFIGEGYTRTAGFQFTVGAAPLSISALGVRDWDGGGLDNSHQVGLWDVDGNSLGGITVSPGPSTDGFRYVSLIAPIRLDAGHSYVIGATYINMDSDRIGLSRTWENASPVYNSAVSFNVIRFGDSISGLTFPNLLGFPDVELGQFGPNAEFAIVPEPSATVLLCASLVCIFFVRRFLQRHIIWKGQRRGRLCAAVALLLYAYLAMFSCCRGKHPFAVARIDQRAPASPASCARTLADHNSAASISGRTGRRLGLDLGWRSGKVALWFVT